MEVPISWKLQVQGASDVKQRLSEINDQFQRGEISAQDYAKGLREVNRDANSYVNISRTQNRIFLATNPLYNTISRSMSTVASISRNILSITTALNLQFLRQNQDTSAMAEAQHELAQAQRDYNKALRTGDLEKASEALEKIGIAQTRIRELTDQKSQQQITDWFNLFATGALTVSSLMKVFERIGPVTAGSIALLAAEFAPFVAVATAGWFAGQYLAYAIEYVIDALGDLDYLYWSKIEPFFTNMVEFFTKTIPLGIGQLGQYVANFFVNDLPVWATIAFDFISVGFYNVWEGIKSMFVTGLQFIIDKINDFVGFIRRFVSDIISLFNSIVFKGSSSRTSTNSFSGMSGSSVVNSLHAATGFEGVINSPTLMTVAESGSEYVSVTPHGKSPNGSTIIQNIHVHGSILAEKQLGEISNKYMKEGLKRRGFTGL